MPPGVKVIKWPRNEVRTHNDESFSAYKGSSTAERKVTELAEGKGSLELLRGER